MSIEITLWQGLRDPHGSRYRTSWPALCARLERPVVTEDKHAVRGLSLATFRDDTRSLDRVEKVCALGLDFDGVKNGDPLDWPLLVERLGHVASVIHTTWSSTPEARRARAFVLLSRPVTAAEYRVIYASAAARLAKRGLFVDRNASDPSRLWFLPSHRPGAEFLYATSTARAQAWQLPEVIEIPAPPPPPQLSLSDAAGDIPSRAASYLEHVGPAISGSGGGTHTFIVAQKLVRGFGLDDDTAFALLSRWNQTCQPPWSPRELRRKIEQARSRGTMAEGSLANAERPR